MTLQNLTSFARDRRGNVATVFAISLLPIMAAMATAVDYSRASRVSTHLQLATDTAALALAKLPATTTQAALQAQATAMVTASMRGTLIPGSLTVTPVRGTSTITVDAKANYPAIIAPVIGVSNVPLTSHSTVTWGNTRLRVALALDVTGSMASDGKMAAMKTAAQNLIKQLKDAAVKDGDVYVSIIPFAKDVNVKSVPNISSFIKWSGSSDTWDENNGTCAKPSYCSSYPTAQECGRTRSTKSACEGAGRTWTATSHGSWTGCVMDRDQSYDTTNTAPTNWSTNFPAEDYDACPASLMGLSYDWTALDNKVKALQPLGGTNQGIGLAWAFQSLTASPFTIPPLEDDYQYSQVIILLSDGLNTQNRFYGNGSTPSAQVDARQKLLCDNVKVAGIKLYTVHVNTDGDPTSTLLKGCASDPSKFFLLTSASQIVTTFNQIGTDLSSLRVAK